MNPRRLALVTFLFVLLASGCGKKGPLYLPEPAPPAPPAAPASP